MTAAPELLGKPIRPRIKPQTAAICQLHPEAPFEPVDNSTLTTPKQSRPQSHPTEEKRDHTPLTEHLLNADLCSPADNYPSLENGLDAADMPIEVFQNMMFQDFMLPTAPTPPHHTSATRAHYTIFLASSHSNECEAYSGGLFRTHIYVTEDETSHADYCGKTETRSSVEDAPALKFLNLHSQEQRILVTPRNVDGV